MTDSQLLVNNDTADDDWASDEEDAPSIENAVGGVAVFQSILPRLLGR